MLRCIDDCPCYKNCPLGCANCESPSCPCSDPGSNPDYLACEKDASETYTACIATCDHGDINACVAACNSDYNTSINLCPCNSGCPGGCPCPGYECEGAEKPESNTIFAFSGYNTANRPFLTDINGNVDYDVKMTIESFTDIKYSCSVMWRQKVYVFGGEKYKNQISVLNNNNGCSLHRIGEMNMNFQRGTCGLGSDNKFYLCFDYYGDNSQCYTTDDPLKPFTATAKSKYPHSSTRIGMGKGEFIVIGHSKSSTNSKYVEFFNHASQSWETGPSWPYSGYYYYNAPVYHKGSYYFFGGYTGSSSDIIARLDANRTWKKLEPGKMNHPRHAHAVAVFGDSFLAFGGPSENYSERCEYTDWGDVITCQDINPRLKYYYYDLNFHYVPDNFCKTT